MFVLSGLSVRLTPPDVIRTSVGTTYDVLCVRVQHPTEPIILFGEMARLPVERKRNSISQRGQA